LAADSPSPHKRLIFEVFRSLALAKHLGENNKANIGKIPDTCGIIDVLLEKIQKGFEKYIEIRIHE